MEGSNRLTGKGLPEWQKSERGVTEAFWGRPEAGAKDQLQARPAPCNEHYRLCEPL